MSAALAPHPARTITASLPFVEPVDGHFFTYTFKPPEGTPGTNFKPRAETVEVTDLRTFGETPALDVHGFQIVPHRTKVRDFWDEAQTMALGHPEAAEIVQRVTGAKRVVVFDHTLRKRMDGVSDRTPGQARQPAQRAHVDQTVLSGPQRVRDLMGEDAEDLLTRRAAIINVWRPIHHVARDWPLAFADARSVKPKNLVPSDLIFPHRTGEIYTVTYDPGQRWLYVPDMAPDETILIKCWDSDETVARFTPHTAFRDPTTPEGTPPRESIEFRTIAFF